MEIQVLVADDPMRARLFAQGRELRCCVGAAGAVVDKREGDCATPIGCWPVRGLYYREDRMERPASGLAATGIDPDLGWCDDPSDPSNYNRPITLPCVSRHERLWREDGLYDLLVDLGYNDAPAVPGRGSAIFIHVARPDYGPTAGCVALALRDLVDVVGMMQPGDAVRITRIYP
ncbi:MAG: L,D-transpeptidase family protein [Alphaproteobacteria bacterium]|nr:L,D-transpeptidase family protein [Alphaproteobacteria bacterium]